MIPGHLEHTFSRAVAMMAASERHHRYTVSDLERLLAPPLRLGQFCHFEKPDGGLIATWALLDEVAEQGFIDGTRKLKSTDWAAGDRFWIMNVLTSGDGSRLWRGACRSIRSSYPKVSQFKHRRFRPGQLHRYATMEFANALPS